MNDLLARVEQAEGFEWDEGNLPKIWKRHQVRFTECEEVFTGDPRLLLPDPRHSRIEERFVVHGGSRASRWLGVVFTLRGKLIRVVSARDLNRRERGELQRGEEAEADSQVP